MIQFPISAVKPCRFSPRADRKFPRISGANKGGRTASFSARRRRRAPPVPVDGAIGPGHHTDTSAGRGRSDAAETDEPTGWCRRPAPIIAPDAADPAAEDTQPAARRVRGQGSDGLTARLGRWAGWVFVTAVVVGVVNGVTLVGAGWGQVTTQNVGCCRTVANGYVWHLCRVPSYDIVWYSDIVWHRVTSYRDDIHDTYIASRGVRICRGYQMTSYDIQRCRVVSGGLVRCQMEPDSISGCLILGGVVRTTRCRMSSGGVSWCRAARC